MTARASEAEPSAITAAHTTEAASAGAGSPTEAEEPRPWLTEEDSAGWRVRYRGRGAVRPHGAVKQSLLIELDERDLTWLEQRSAEAGITPADYVKRLIDRDRAA